MKLDVGRLLWCLVVAVRARRYQVLIISLIGLVGIVAALGTVVVVWFGYGVAHTGKSAKTDLIVLLSSAPPFFFVSFGLWQLGGKLQSRLPPADGRCAPLSGQGGVGSVTYHEAFETRITVVCNWQVKSVPSLARRKGRAAFAAQIMPPRPRASLC